MEPWQLKQRQSLDLDAKVCMSQERIREWYEYWDGYVYVSFSGGKDSTVLLHLVKSLYPHVDAVFVDTGLEYPEIKEFVRTVRDVTIIRPKMSFREVLDKYGYPVVSKETAQKIHEIRTTKSEKLLHKRLHGDTNKYKSGKLPEKWKYLLDAPFKISHRCCDIMKKDPAKRFEKETGLYPYLGNMACDSHFRRQQYVMRGCNAFDTKRPTSTPMAFWTTEDVWEYIRRYNLTYCRVYDMGYKTTGCIFCCFGLHKEQHPNRFELLKDTHPKLYKYCMNSLGLRKVLNYTGGK